MAPHQMSAAQRRRPQAQQPAARQLGPALLSRSRSSAPRKRAQTKAQPQEQTSRKKFKLDLKLGTKEARDRLFRKLDDNASGTLTFLEIERGMRVEYKALDTFIRAKKNGNRMLQRAYKAADKGGAHAGDGLVSRDEFRLLVEYIEFFANLWEQFEEVDANGDGTLDVAEFVQGFMLIEPDTHLSKEELELEFNHVDNDNSGTILFDEFCAWMAKRKRDDAPQIHAGQHQQPVDLELVLSCTGLLREGKNRTDIGSMDTQAVVSEVRVVKKDAPQERSGKEKKRAKRAGEKRSPRKSVRDVTHEVVGKTEIVKRCSCPSWTQFIETRLKKSKNILYQQQLSVSIFLVNAKGQQIKELGMVTFGLQDLYNARWRRMTFDLQSRAESLGQDMYGRTPVSYDPDGRSGGADDPPRLSICAVERAPTKQKAWLRMQFQATEIPRDILGFGGAPDEDGEKQPAAEVWEAGQLARRPDTYLQISRQVQGFLQPLYRSEVVPQSFSPKWKDTGVSMQHFCCNDDECTVAVELYMVETLSVGTGKDVKTVKIQEQRADLRVGQRLLTARQVADAGQRYKDGVAAAGPGSEGAPDGGSFSLESYLGNKESFGGWLSVLQLETYYPERGTARRELHLEDKHFADDRQFLSELLGENGKSVLTGDVVDHVDVAQRYVEQCCQSWIARRREDEADAGAPMRRRRLRKGSTSSEHSDESTESAVGKAAAAFGSSQVTKKTQQISENAVSGSKGAVHTKNLRGRVGANLWLPNKKIFATGTKEDRMKTYGLEGHRKKVEQQRKRDSDSFRVRKGKATYRIGSQRLKAGLRSYDPVAVEQKARELDPDGQITEDALELAKLDYQIDSNLIQNTMLDPHLRMMTMLEKEWSNRNKAMAMSPTNTPAKKTPISPDRKSRSPGKSNRGSPEKRPKRERHGRHIVHDDHLEHYDNHLANHATEGVKLMTSSIRHKGLASPRLAHTSSNLFSKTRLGDEWKAASELGQKKVQGSKVVDTPRRQPLYPKPPTPEPPEPDPRYDAAKPHPPASAKGKAASARGRPASAPIGGRRVTRARASTARPSSKNPYSASGVTQRQKTRKKKKAEGHADLVRWLVGIGAEDVLKNFEAEGFSTMAEVHRAGLSEEDLVVLGFEDEETRAKAVGSLAQMNAELGREINQIVKSLAL